MIYWTSSFTASSPEATSITISFHYLTKQYATRKLISRKVTTKNSLVNQLEPKKPPEESISIYLTSKMIQTVERFNASGTTA